MQDQESGQSGSGSGDITRRTLMAAAGLAIVAGTVEAGEPRSQEKKKEEEETKGYIIVTDEKKPELERPRGGKRYKTVSVQVTDPTLKPAKAVGARLCGGTDSCVALIEVE
jgi:hypothetical protein